MDGWPARTMRERYRILRGPSSLAPAPTTRTTTSAADASVHAAGIKSRENKAFSEPWTIAPNGCQIARRRELASLVGRKHQPGEGAAWRIFIAGPVSPRVPRFRTGRATAHPPVVPDAMTGGCPPHRQRGRIFATTAGARPPYRCMPAAAMTRRAARTAATIACLSCTSCSAESGLHDVRRASAQRRGEFASSCSATIRRFARSGSAEERT